jgi:hypothetical protein
MVTCRQLGAERECHLHEEIVEALELAGELGTAGQGGETGAQMGAGIAVERGLTRKLLPLREERQRDGLAGGERGGRTRMRRRGWQPLAQIIDQDVQLGQEGLGVEHRRDSRWHTRGRHPTACTSGTFRSQLTPSVEDPGLSQKSRLNPAAGQ